MAAKKLETTLTRGVEDGNIPHVVVFATNRDGSFTYKYTTGKKNYPNEEPAEEDAVFLLASQTKLLTTIAALQVVERGLYELDQDVAEVLPELASQGVLTGFEEDNRPIIAKRKNKLTLRHLLTHSSGAAYDAADPLLMKLSQQTGREPNTGFTIMDRFNYPLVFEPGTSWSYGTGIDWAGRLVEKVSNMSLEDWMKTNMWEPLGVTEITFWPLDNSNLRSRVPGLTIRTPEGGLAPFSAPFINTGSKDCFGGHGAYATMSDYLKVQHSILSNDGKLLKPSTVDQMFQPQLSTASAQALNEFTSTSPLAAMMVGSKPKGEVNWGLGGILYMQDDAGKRKKGTLSWGGMTNPFWLIDREAGLALTFGTQVLPPGDAGVEDMISACELAVYEMAGVKF